jgi:hypothetical protein
MKSKSKAELEMVVWPRKQIVRGVVWFLRNDFRHFVDGISKEVVVGVRKEVKHTFSVPATFILQESIHMHVLVFLNELRKAGAHSFF